MSAYQWFFHTFTVIGAVALGASLGIPRAKFLGKTVPPWYYPTLFGAMVLCGWFCMWAVD